MFPRYRHTPIFDTNRKRCSICDQPVYSLAGIHPQCAIKLPEPQQYGTRTRRLPVIDALPSRISSNRKRDGGPDKSLPASRPVPCRPRHLAAEGLKLARSVRLDRPVSG